jgi:hypothetical protein
MEYTDSGRGSSFYAGSLECETELLMQDTGEEYLITENTVFLTIFCC